MCHSVKKSPVWTDHETPGTRWSKRQANKAVRRFKDDVQNGKWYRKLFNPWNICDYHFYKTERQAIQDWESCPLLQDQFPTEADVRNDWAKSYRRK